MPYWIAQEEKQLINMVKEGEALEDIATALGRTPDAISMKLKRMDLPVPPRKKSRAKSAENKVTINATTTTTPKPKPIKMAKDLISPEEALKMWLGCVKRLNEPGCTPQDVKRIRLILTSLKGYIIVCSDYYERIRTVELKMEQLKESMLKYYKMQYEMAHTEEEKAEWQRQIDELEVEPEAREELKAKKYHVWPRTARRSGYP